MHILIYLSIVVNAEAAEAHAAREMAAELIRIADLLEDRVLFRAADSLTKKLRTSPLQVRNNIKVQPNLISSDSTSSSFILSFCFW